MQANGPRYRYPYRPSFSYKPKHSDIENISEFVSSHRYKYLGLHIYEVNKNEENEEFIIKKINETLNELEPLDLNNKTIIRCINTQVMGQIRYYI